MAIRNMQDGGGRHLEFVRIENSAISCAVPENPTIEPNMKWITRCRDMAIRVCWGIWNPRLGEREVVGGQRWHH